MDGSVQPPHPDRWMLPQAPPDWAISCLANGEYSRHWGPPVLRVGATERACRWRASEPPVACLGATLLTLGPPRELRSQRHGRGFAAEGRCCREGPRAHAGLWSARSRSTFGGARAKFDHFSHAHRPRRDCAQSPRH